MGLQKGLEEESAEDGDDEKQEARLLIARNLVARLSGKGGDVIADISNKSGAAVKFLEELPEGGFSGYSVCEVGLGDVRARLGWAGLGRVGLR